MRTRLPSGMACADHGRSILTSSCRPLNHAKDGRDFAPQDLEIQSRYISARMKDDVDPGWKTRDLPANSLSHASLDAVTRDSITQDSADGQSNPWRFGLRRVPVAFTRWNDRNCEEVAHLPREILSRSAVNPLEIGVFPQSIFRGQHMNFPATRG